MSHDVRAFRDALRHLHRNKDAAYGDAWKKRGEVMSILANVARKVDRLEHVRDGAPRTPDESHFDTSVDLLVYALKYQTYLADQDETVAVALFGPGPHTARYSDGAAGFELLLDVLDLSSLETADDLNSSLALDAVLSAFQDIELLVQCEAMAPIRRRAEGAHALICAACNLVASLKQHAPVSFDEFLGKYLEGTN
ncbi:MAG: hypothetical protein ACRDQ5_02355 [Sciscionella sp.]